MLTCSEYVTSSHAINIMGFREETLRVRPRMVQVIPRVWHIDIGCVTSGYHSEELLSEKFGNQSCMSKCVGDMVPLSLYRYDKELEII